MRSLLSALMMAIGLGVAPVAAADQAAPARAELTDDGVIWVTPQGMTLYTFSGDETTPGRSNCTERPVTEQRDPTAGFGNYRIPGYQFAESCAENYPALLAAADAAPFGEWTIIDRSEGARQWAYRGQPLYTSTKDQRAGDRNGVSRYQGASARRGFRFAFAPTDLPPGLGLTRIGEDLVLTSDNGRPLLTSRQASRRGVCAPCSDAFAPLTAPAIAQAPRDWSVIATASGQPQYAFRRRPLYLAPDSLTNLDILDTGEWEFAVYRRGEGRPRQIGTHYSPVIGEVYTDAAGRTLYLFTCTAGTAVGSPGCEDPGGPAANWAALCGSGEECARRWQPYLATSGARAEGDWSIVDVAYPMFTDPGGRTYPAETPRVRAWAYRGRPVYTYYEDHAPGDIFGHMVRWFGFSGFYALQPAGAATQ